MLGILDHRLDDERLTVQGGLVSGHGHALGCLGLTGLGAQLGHRGPGALSRGIGSGPQDDVSMAGGGGGEAARDRAGTRDGESFVQGIS